MYNTKQHKYWESTDVDTLINEITTPENVDTSSIKFNDKLCPFLWENDTLKPEIRKILLKIAYAFIDFSDLNGFQFKDILLTGSMANYNYTKYSDIDIHIVFDYSQISNNKDFVFDYFKLKRDLWESKLPIKVYEHDVELFVEDFDSNTKSTGIYSIINDKWIVKPIKQILNINIDKLKEKTSEFMNIIDDLMTIDNPKQFEEKYKNIKTKLKKYRISGLESNGEFSIENLIFKLLRNNGYLDKMNNKMNTIMTQDLSI